LYLLRAIYPYFHLVPKNNSIDAYIDNQGLISRLTYRKDTAIKYVHRTDSFLTREIQSVLHSLPIKVTPKHVKSHQYDNESDHDAIPMKHFVNKACDISADLAHTCPLCSIPPSPPKFPSTIATVMHQGTPIYSGLNKYFLYATYDSAARDKLISKNHWTQPQADSICWEYYCRAIYQMSPEHRHHSTRITHRLWPTNTVQAKRSKHGNRIEKNANAATVPVQRIGLIFFSAPQLPHF